jgi:hypothetical protein
MEVGFVTDITKYLGYALPFLFILVRVVGLKAGMAARHHRE